MKSEKRQTNQALYPPRIRGLEKNDSKPRKATFCREGLTCDDGLATSAVFEVRECTAHDATGLSPANASFQSPFAHKDSDGGLHGGNHSEAGNGATGNETNPAPTTDGGGGSLHHGSGSLVIDQHNPGSLDFIMKNQTLISVIVCVYVAIR
jgi:hypothetical protein